MRKMAHKEVKTVGEEREAWEGKMCLLAERLNAAATECKSLAAQRDHHSDLRKVESLLLQGCGFSVFGFRLKT